MTYADTRNALTLRSVDLERREHDVLVVTHHKTGQQALTTVAELAAAVDAWLLSILEQHEKH